MYLKIPTKKLKSGFEIPVFGIGTWSMGGRFEYDHVNDDRADMPRWKGIFTVTEEPLVSSDIIGNRHASIADLAFTRVVDGNLVKVLAWFDDEMGHAYTLVNT